jgi:antitoxin component YwqK of YwqJK toxin-antitoxin module
MIKYKKIQDNENAIEIDGKVVLPFDKRFKEYLKWRDKNPKLEKQLVEELEQETENKRLYNNGAPHVMVDKNGKREGRCIFYFENGQKKWEGNYKDGKLNGELIQYRENGDLISKENFIDAKLDGKYEYYYGNGCLRQSGVTRNHVSHDEVRSYYTTGELQTVEYFNMGVRVGKYKKYRLDGTLIVLGEYDNNYQAGTWIYYNAHKKKVREETYEHSVLLKVIDWDENGQKVSESIKSDTGYNMWRNISWYSTGNKRHDINYKNNKLHGSWVEWYVSGQKRANGNMKFGTMDGKWLFYYHNEQKELECEFDFGTPVGGARIYHDNGNIKEEVSLK